MGALSQAEQAPEFCDGLVLARIVQAVSHMRGSIVGLERSPTVCVCVCLRLVLGLEALAWIARTGVCSWKSNAVPVIQTSAAKLQNIRRSLEVLRKKKVR